ncbi:HD domain-containing protein [Paenibacillus sp. TRM 82003]|nr:HD domain-containing protein [Paenibacillus sp. TRM 82003]
MTLSHPASLHPWLAPFLQLSDAVIVTDEQHLIVDVNPVYERTTGYERNEVIGHKAGMLKSGRTPERTYREMKKTLALGRSWSGVFTNRKRDRTEWHSSITITPFAVDGATYYVGVFRELERLKSGHYLPESRVIAYQTSMMRLLAISSEVRDPGIERHLLNVQRLTRGLLRKHAQRSVLSPWPDNFAMQIVSCSLLHDIGKSCVPEGILYKPDALTTFERQIMEMHPLMGLDILKKVESDFEEGLLMEEFSIARNIILHHHERWDGGGYPHRLAGEAIPFEARVVSIVDVYDALVSKRPYKDAWPSREALNYIAAQRGKHFDPAIADSFLALMADEEAY